MEMERWSEKLKTSGNLREERESRDHTHTRSTTRDRKRTHHDRDRDTMRIRVSADTCRKKSHMILDDAAHAQPTSRTGFLPKDHVVESLNVPSRPTSERSPAKAINHPHTKVSSISTTNETKGVNITRSDEFNGNSSTDGTPTTPGNIGNVHVDVSAKPEKLAQIRKVLSEKLSKITSGTSSGSLASQSVGSKEGNKAPKSANILPATSIAASMGASGVTATHSAFSTVAAAANPSVVVDSDKAIKRAQEHAAKMGFRLDPEFPPLMNLFPGQLLRKPTRLPVLRLDGLGREIDEHGNVVRVSKPSNLSTLKVNINKQKKEAFKIHKPELDVDPEKNPYFDPRMGINKNKILRPRRMRFHFIEEGKWSKDAESIKWKNQFGEAKLKELEAKKAQLAKPKAELDINPNLIEVSETIIPEEKSKEPIPEVEWWDAPLLLSGSYGDIADGSTIDAKLKVKKLTVYVEHPRPVEPSAEPAPPRPQPLKLTKKEQKKFRTQQRLAREKEKQEMIRQGLIEPPKPKVKLSNLMKVLGSEATQNPTKLEREIRAAAAEREQAHMDRSIARKLTPAERREKKERKLFSDHLGNASNNTVVSVYKIYNDLSHPKHRFKVDINAQENHLTGCAVIFEGFSVVVVEGGRKSIDRYKKLMLQRMDWAAKLEHEGDLEHEAEEKLCDNSNKCVLIWEGSVAEPSFNKFLIHQYRTEAAAHKVFSDAGVGHYWEQAASSSENQI